MNTFHHPVQVLEPRISDTNLWYQILPKEIATYYDTTLLYQISPKENGNPLQYHLVTTHPTFTHFHQLVRVNMKERVTMT